ncbi:DUF4282 domain-containing protein [Guyparkeria halophila]
MEGNLLFSDISPGRRSPAGHPKRLTHCVRQRGTVPRLDRPSCFKKPRTKKGPRPMKDLLFFDKMLTPKFITVIYWLLLVGVVIGGIGMMFGGFNGFSFGTFISGLLTIVFGAIGARIWCELMIVLFKMNEALQDMRHK